MERPAEQSHKVVAEDTAEDTAVQMVGGTAERMASARVELMAAHLRLWGHIRRRYCRHQLDNLGPCLDGHIWLIHRLISLPSSHG